MHSSGVNTFALGLFRIVIMAAKFEKFNEKWNELGEVIEAEVWSVFRISYFVKSWKLNLCFDILFWRTSGSDMMSSWSLVRILNGVLVRTPSIFSRVSQNKQLYLYLSLVERKVVEFCHSMDRRLSLVWLNWPIFIKIWKELRISLTSLCIRICFCAIVYHTYR